MSATTMPAPSNSLSRTFALGLLLLGSGGAAAAWALLALSLDRQCGWMALIAAVDAAWLLRLGRMPRGATRALLAGAGTALAIGLANWWIAGAQIGQMVGLLPWDAIPRLGWSHAWTLFSLANQGAELAWYGLALAVAVWTGR